jgi:hypothetical protein
MADMLERLNREDDPDVFGMPTSDMSEEHRDRFAVSAKTPMLDFAAGAGGGN